MLGINDVLRHTERRRVFNIDGLRQLASQSVTNRSSDDIVDLKKLAEGGFNRAFLLTMQCARRLPNGSAYPVPGYDSQVLRCRW